MRLFLTTSADKRGFSITLGLHTLIGLLGNFRRQVGDQNADVHNLDAQFGHVGRHQIAGFTHHFRTLFGQRRIELTQAVNGTQSRFQTGCDTLFGQLEAAEHRLAEPDGIDDTVGDERVDDIELAARNLQADAFEVIAQQALVDVLNGFHEIGRYLEINSRLLDFACDFAEAHHDGLFALVDDEQG